jgi:hypothetical protein
MMSDFGGNFLTGSNGSTWVDEHGGIIPKGTNTSPADARKAAITLTEMSLAVFGDPEEDTPAWHRARDMARRVIDACGLAGAS